MAEPMKVLQRLEIDAKEQYDEEERAFEAGALVREAKLKAAKKEIKEALETGGDADAIAKKIISGVTPTPTRKRYIVNDSTVEKLGELLNENTNGLLVRRDELIGLLKHVEKEGQECARAFYLEAWNGNDRFVYDRIARGTIDIEACCVSVLGGIQPGPMGHYLRDAIKGGKGDDGFIQRFQLLVYPDVSAAWRDVDRWPDSTAKDQAWQTYQRLDTMTAGDVGAVIEDEGDLPTLRFDDEALHRFRAWRTEHEPRVRSGMLPGGIEAVQAKQRSLVPSLALVFQLADAPSAGAVQLPALERALRWVPYLDSHADRIYASVLHPEVKPAKTIIDKVNAGKLPIPFTARDVYNHGWSGLASKDQAQPALDLLVDCDWLVEQKIPTPGRPKNVFTPTNWPQQNHQKPPCAGFEGEPRGETREKNKPQPQPHNLAPDVAATEQPDSDTAADGWGSEGVL